MLLPLIASLMLAQDLAKQPPLIAAIQMGSLEAAKVHLSKGVDPNSRVILTSKPNLFEGHAGGVRSNGTTALILAVERESEPLVSLLLEYKANPNLTGISGWTPLMTACMRQNLAVVKQLLKHGALPNLRNVHGNTAIVFAANTDRVDMVEALVEAGADVNGGTRETALMVAAQSGSEKTVKYLLSIGVDPNFRRRGYMSALEYAGDGYGNSIVEMIKKSGGKRRTPDQMREPVNSEDERRRAYLESVKSKKTEDSLPDSKILPDDGPVLQTVALDLLTGKDRSFLVFDEKTPMIVAILPETSGRFNEHTEYQMNGELDEKRANDIDLEMRRNWKARNQKPATLLQKMFSDPRVVVRKVETRSLFGRSEIPRGEAHRGWIQPMLPAYSTDGNRAMVRMWFGPSPHGAAATYFLKKSGSNWVVVWRDFAFYS